jgi:hypothetical protein
VAEAYQELAVVLLEGDSDLGSDVGLLGVLRDDHDLWHKEKEA